MATTSQQQQAPPLPVRFDEAGEEVDDDEVLTAAESYERLLTSTKEQLFGMIRQLNQYDTLVKKLKGVRDERTRDVLVPVAGGLGYFSGRITHTNELMVLLGNNWFAERSVSQGLGIAERRIEFLKREIKVLEEQVKSITSKQDMFMASALDQQQDHNYPPEEAVSTKRSHAAAQKPKAKATPASSGSAVSTTTPTPTSAVTANSNNNNTNSTGAATTKNPVPPYQPEEDDVDEEDDEYYDENEPIIEPEDELTLNELIAIEDELGDDIANEELAEKAILAKIAEKRRKRLGLPDEGVSTTSPKSPIPTATNTTAPATSNPSANTASASATEAPVPITTPTSSSAPFFSPGDIGKGFVAAAKDEETATTTPAAASVADSPKKQVHFTDPMVIAVAAAPTPAASTQQHQPMVVPSRNVTPAASVRSTNAAQTDNIVVHDSSSDDEEVRPTPVVAAPQQAGRAKKSRFAKENGL